MTDTVRLNGLATATLVGGWVVTESRVSSVTLPIAPELSANHRFPSDPVVIPTGLGMGTTVLGIGISGAITLVAGLIESMAPLAKSVNQRRPSGPVVIRI